MEHGASRYSQGCRCEVCRAGKAEYTRKRRAAASAARIAAQAQGQRYVAQGITHGLSGYKDIGCRCFTCRLSNAEQSAARRRRKAAEGAA